jgi:beta-lactamase regulating signal transducer with metallopeptidase domain
MNITASIIIITVMIFRFSLKKAPKTISYVLWSIVGLRLVIPFTTENILSNIKSNIIPVSANNSIQVFPKINDSIIDTSNTIKMILPSPEPLYDININPLSIWIKVGMYIWVIGVGAMLIYMFVSILSLKLKLRNAICIGNNQYESVGLKTPFVLGLFHSKIYIPADLIENDRNYVVLHEQIHIRRLDHIVKYIAYLVLCIHWFNPFAWIAFLLMGMDMEMCCDERVLKEIDGSYLSNEEKKTEYSMSLLSMALGRRIIGGSPLAFGEGDIKKRVKNVMSFKKHSRVLITISICFILSALLIITIYFSLHLTFAKTYTNNSISKSLMPLVETDITSVTEMETPAAITSVAASGSISASDDGSTLNIWLGAGAEMSMGCENWEKGDKIIFGLKSSDEFEIEIGIIAVSDNPSNGRYGNIYSERTEIGSTINSIVITVPNDGKYGLYCKNNSIKEETFTIIPDPKISTDSQTIQERLLAVATETASKAYSAMPTFSLTMNKISDNQFTLENYKAETGILELYTTEDEKGFFLDKGDSILLTFVTNFTPSTEEGFSVGYLFNDKFYDLLGINGRAGSLYDNAIFATESGYYNIYTLCHSSNKSLPVEYIKISVNKQIPYK